MENLEQIQKQIAEEKIKLELQKQQTSAKQQLQEKKLELFKLKHQWFFNFTTEIKNGLSFVKDKTRNLMVSQQPKIKNLANMVYGGIGTGPKSDSKKERKNK